MRRRTAALLIPVISLAVAGACGGGGGGKDKEDGKAAPAAPLSGDAPVRIVNFEFKPQKVAVKPGTKVTWSNDDTNIHDIKDTSPLNTPVSKELSKGDTFAITYAQPGSYSYVCGIHPYMTGSVEVVP